MEIQGITLATQAVSLLAIHSRPSVRPVISDRACGKGLITDAPRGFEQEHKYQESACHMRQYGSCETVRDSKVLMRE